MQKRHSILISVAALLAVIGGIWFWMHYEGSGVLDQSSRSTPTEAQLHQCAVAVCGPVDRPAFIPRDRILDEAIRSSVQNPSRRRAEFLALVEGTFEAFLRSEKVTREKQLAWVRAGGFTSKPEHQNIMSFVALMEVFGALGDANWLTFELGAPVVHRNVVIETLKDAPQSLREWFLADIGKILTDPEILKRMVASNMPPHGALSVYFPAESLALAYKQMVDELVAKRRALIADPAINQLLSESGLLRDLLRAMPPQTDQPTHSQVREGLDFYFFLNMLDVFLGRRIQLASIPIPIADLHRFLKTEERIASVLAELNNTEAVSEARDTFRDLVMARFDLSVAMSPEGSNREYQELFEKGRAHMKALVTTRFPPGLRSPLDAFLNRVEPVYPMTKQEVENIFWDEFSSLKREMERELEFMSRLDQYAQYFTWSPLFMVGIPKENFLNNEVIDLVDDLDEIAQDTLSDRMIYFGRSLVRVSAYFTKLGEAGLNVVLHEFGHAVSFELRRLSGEGNESANAFISEKKTCLGGRHGPEGGDQHSEEDLADGLSAAARPLAPAGCIFVDLDEGRKAYNGLMIKRDAGDDAPHSAGLFRALTFYRESGEPLPRACAAVVSAPSRAVWARSCFAAPTAPAEGARQPGR